MATETPTSWVHAVLETVISVWQALVVPTCVGFFAFYKFRSGRQDTKEQATDGSKRDARRDGMTYEQQLRDALLAAGVDAKENTRWLIEEQKRILAQVEADKDEAWGECDRWRQIATHCHRRWVETTGDLRQAQAVADARGRRLRGANLLSEDEMSAWPVIPLVPDLEAIVPKHER